MADIGIDASWACGDRAGMGILTLDLVRGLLELDRENTYHLYFRSCCRHNNPLFTIERPNLRSHIVDARVTVVRAILSLGWALRRDRIDVFVGPNYFLPMFGAKRYITVFHDLSIYNVGHLWWRRDRRLNLLIMRLAFPMALRRANRVVAISRATLSDLERFFPRAARKASVVYNACDTARFFSPADRQTMPAPPTNGPYFLYVGVMSPTKNLERILRAFARFRNEGHSEYSLVLAGRDCGGYMENTLVPMLGKLDLEDAVIHTGFIDDAQLGSLYRGAVALVFPSLSEGFGYPIIEAMSQGLPVIASNVTSCPEVAGGAALCLDPCSIDAIFEAIRKLALDSNLREELSALGLKRAAEFTIGSMARGYLKEIRQLLNDIG